ncbi:G-box-binding factor 4 -like protein [Gossypium arboreum]|uniref:Uncharacterized protein n=3 Tax=Gossypium TaxID=3633 RepID=A0ABR0QMC7_GOSAR|nr:G-box-binding factor 4-like isoform X1 [Gossypium hirsutum]XP_017649855.1 G-box-binding factor 4 [Gossypium arboreum]KAG4210728.1 hypothetical protein ERO13_A02G063700v2 [Gossypium hirsutum]KAK5840492.1 hypothetical protein PVK06_009393 [Gossypium arboreum]KHG27104.1 G-box-binding factor 4 -like protein [Gossypium arboreum]
MASSTSNSRNSDLSRRSTTSSSSKPQIFTDQKTNDDNENRLSSTMTVDGILRNVYSAAPSTETTLVDASITLIDAPIPNSVSDNPEVPQVQTVADCNNNVAKSVDEVWREIVSGERKEITMKEEVPDEMMTLEDFLAKAGAVEEAAAVASAEVKLHPDRLSGGVYTFDPVGGGAFQILDKMEGSIVGLGNGMEVIGSGGGGGRGKRGRGVLMEPLDKAAQQRQRRMIKNRESAARSRERKQAYQVELESLAVRLEEENEWLLKEKAERTKERFKQLMEKVVPVVEQRRPPRMLRRVRSLQW